VNTETAWGAVKIATAARTTCLDLGRRRQPTAGKAMWLLGLSFIVGCGGSISESPKTAPSADFAAMVDIGGGREMYLQCRGTGAPTVVLVSGARGALDDWTYVAEPGGTPKESGAAVFPGVARFTRVCAYDRPGTLRFDGALTASTRVPQPTTAQAGAIDLDALLGAAHESGPYVLVGHSWGGLIVRPFANSHPREVSGLALLDPGSEFLPATLTPSQWEQFVSGARQLGEPQGSEAADYVGSLEELRPSPPAPDVPTVVLTSDHQFDFGAGGPETWPAWLRAQDQLARLLGATHITDTNSGHFIQGEQPHLVIDAIREIVDAARK